MTDDRVERAIQFLLDNQAAHDVRRARLEEIVVEIANNQKEMQLEFRESLEKILTVAEETMKAVQAVAEAETRTIRRVDEIEDKIK
jgi:hypothetical protein